jgi:hypothetical protein
MNVSPEGAVDFFISYTEADRDWAEWVAWQLEEAGYSTVLQAWDFRPGANFVAEMQDAVAAQRTLVRLSPDYMQSAFGFAEWAAAFAKDPRGRARHLVPVRVAECDAAGLLAQIVWIDLVGLDDKDARRRVLDGLDADRAKPSSPPEYPGLRDSAVRPSLPPSFPAEPPGDTYQVRIGDNNRDVVIGKQNTTV